jgi:YbbR domain-containing protein
LWKVASVAIALGLWLATVGESDVETSVTVPLQLMNVPPGLAISSYTPGQIRLNIRGPASRVSPRDLSGVAVMVDLSAARPGDRSIPIDSSSVTLPDDVRLEGAQPAEIDLKLEQLVRREVPVRARVSEAPVGWEFESVEVAPPRVQVSGPESSMRQIQEAQTELLEISPTDANAAIAAHALLTDPAVRFDAGSRVTVKVKLRKKEAK